MSGAAATAEEPGTWPGAIASQDRSDGPVPDRAGGIRHSRSRRFPAEPTLRPMSARETLAAAADAHALAGCAPGRETGRDVPSGSVHTRAWTATGSTLVGPQCTLRSESEASLPTLGETGLMDAMATPFHWRITLADGRVEQSNFHEAGSAPGCANTAKEGA